MRAITDLKMFDTKSKTASTGAEKMNMKFFIHILKTDCLQK